MIKKEIDGAFYELLERYGISPNKHFSFNNINKASCQLLPGYMYVENNNNNRQLPLLYWRIRRPILELKKIIDDRVIHDVCLIRCSHLGNFQSGGLKELIYQKLDICEFITSNHIISVFAVTNDPKHVNIIAKLSSGVICSIEICLNLSQETSVQVRNEIIARRGVASDRVVDTQIQQHSIYCFSQNGNKCYTDSDMELFGFNAKDTELIRSGFEIVKNKSLQLEWKKQHKRLTTLVNAVFKSANTQLKQIIP